MEGKKTQGSNTSLGINFSPDYEIEFKVYFFLSPLASLGLFTHLLF